jgi:heptosyltransferase-3
VPRLTVNAPEVLPPGVRRLALHPGSGSEDKNWPETQWGELLRQLVALTDLHLLLVGGEAEGERLQRLSSLVPPARIRLAQNLALTELAGLLSQSCGFIGHDSGITHLAAAVGLPGIVLWGETAEEIWRPPSEKFRLLRHPAGLAELSVAEVLEISAEHLVSV